MLQQEFQLQVGDRLVSYSLEFARRRTMSIVVQPDLRVVVKAPILAPLREVLEVVQKRGLWIVKHLELMEKSPRALISAKNWADGEAIYFLGKKFTLRLRAGSKRAVDVHDDEIFATAPQLPDAALAERMVETWYLAQAKLIFAERLKKYAYVPQMESVQAVKELRVKRLRRRWGSCSSTGNILLNTHLIKAPMECIDYVIIHELCHLKHMNHSKNYYATLAKYCPDWKLLKIKLEAAAK